MHPAEIRRTGLTVTGVLLTVCLIGGCKSPSEIGYRSPGTVPHLMGPKLFVGDTGTGASRLAGAPSEPFKGKLKKVDSMAQGSSTTTRAGYVYRETTTAWTKNQKNSIPSEKGKAWRAMQPVPGLKFVHIDSVTVFSMVTNGLFYFRTGLGVTHRGRVVALKEQENE